MDVIGFWQKQVQQWNDEQMCENCWTFGAPLLKSGIEKSEFKEEEDCCVHVFVTNLDERTDNQYARTGLLQRRAQVYNMTVYFLKQDADLGENVYNEIPHHPISESKWIKTLKPIKECLKAENILDFCLHLGYNVEIVNFQLFAEINVFDGYTGWSLRLTLRNQDED